MKTYHVFLAPEGSGETYIGRATSMREAHKLAAEHARGERDGLADYDYGQARHVAAMISPPPPTGEAEEWFGRGGWYCACLELDREEVEA